MDLENKGDMTKRYLRDRASNIMTIIARISKSFINEMSTERKNN
jgi:hypothetical protein